MLQILRSSLTLLLSSAILFSADGGVIIPQTSTGPCHDVDPYVWNGHTSCTSSAGCTGGRALQVTVALTASDCAYPTTLESETSVTGAAITGANSANNSNGLYLYNSTFVDCDGNSTGSSLYNYTC